MFPFVCLFVTLKFVIDSFEIFVTSIIYVTTCSLYISSSFLIPVPFPSCENVSSWILSSITLTSLIPSFSSVTSYILFSTLYAVPEYVYFASVLMSIFSLKYSPTGICKTCSITCILPASTVTGISV